MFCPLCGNGTTQQKPPKPTLTCPSCKREEPPSIDEATLTQQRPFLRECVECHGPLLAVDIYCRKCGTKYDIWITGAEQGR